MFSLQKGYHRVVENVQHLTAHTERAALPQRIGG